MSAELESNGDIERLENLLEAERNRRRVLEDEKTELREQVTELQETVDMLVAEYEELKESIDNIAGVNGTEESTATTRQRDLVVILRRKAERNGGKYAMDYNDVKDDLAAQGHGRIDDKQAYRDMDRIAERVRGVSSTAVDGNTAVSIDLDRFNGLPSAEDESSDGVSRKIRSKARSDQFDTDESSTKQT